MRDDDGTCGADLARRGARGIVVAGAVGVDQRIAAAGNAIRASLDVRHGTGAEEDAVLLPAIELAVDEADDLERRVAEAVVVSAHAWLSLYSPERFGDRAEHIVLDRLTDEYGLNHEERETVRGRTRFHDLVARVILRCGADPDR